jgi:hypothetical protein
MSVSADSARQLLRHALATVAYRGGKAVRNAPPSFANFELGEKPRTPVQILAHMGDLFDWALSIASGKEAWKNATPLPWDVEVERFFVTLKKFDDFLASDEPLHAPLEGLFQGPVADALTHIGQIAMLRRLAGCSMKSENYARAEIQAGRVGAEQPKARREF